MNVALTRPVGKSEPLSELLTAQGIGSVICPVLQLDAVSVSDTASAMVAEAELAIFVSPDAVGFFHSLDIALPSHCQVLAVGQGTAKALQDKLAVKAKYPQQADSEGLLALPELAQVEGKRVLLVKGKGGRTLIANTLKSRGAILDNLVVYQRTPIKANSDSWLDHWRSQQITGIVITSNTAADAIFNVQDTVCKDWLQGNTFFVVSQRTADYLQHTYHIIPSHIVVCPGPDNQAIAATIADHTKQQGSKMTQSESQKNNAKKDAEPSAAVTPAVTQALKPGISKLALLALVVALGSSAGVGYLYLQQQQQLQQTQMANQAIAAENNLLQSQLSDTKSQLQRLDNAFAGVQQHVNEQLAQQQLQVDEQLSQTLAQAKQQVSGALAAEVLYLQRLAAFKVAAEQDYLGAVAVLTRLDEILAAESNSSAVRKAIAADIAKLEALPKPQTEALYYQLHGMLEQVDTLAVKSQSLPQPQRTEESQLSQNVNDWQSNLKRSWQQLVDDFITVRRHDEVVIDPLLDKNEKLLIRAQLRAYLTQAQTAVVEQQASIFFAALSGAKQTITRYFDSDDANTVAMLQTLKELSRSEIQSRTDITLSTPKALQGWLQ